jgi:hypothetical protein
MGMRAGMVGFGLFLLVGFTGCGSGSAKTAGEAEKKVEAKAPEAPKPPATPDAAVNNVKTKLLENKPQVLWQSLPPSYQKDVSGLVTAFANSCDQDVYNQSFQLVKKVGMILKNKKDLILATMPPPPPPGTAPTPEELAPGAMPKDPKVVGEAIDLVGKIISTITTSDLADLSKVKALDVEKTLSTSGSQLMVLMREFDKFSTNGLGDKLKAEVSSLKTTVVKQDGHTATIKMEVDDGKPPKEKQFVRVEGHWIPKEMADTWKDEMAKAKKTIEESVSKTKTQSKDKTLSQLKMVDAVLDQMLAAKTKEELNAAMQSGMMAGLGLMMALQQAAGEAGGPGGIQTPPPPPGGVK